MEVLGHTSLVSSAHEAGSHHVGQCGGDSPSVAGTLCGCPRVSAGGWADIKPFFFSANVKIAFLLNPLLNRNSAFNVRVRKMQYGTVQFWVISF